jgi:hypothetical protein
MTITPADDMVGQQASQERWSGIGQGMTQGRAILDRRQPSEEHGHG